MTLAAVLAYHADDEIARVREQWLVALVVALALAVALAAVLLRRRATSGGGPNWESRIALALTLVLAPFVGFAPLLFVFPLFAPAPLLALGLAIAGVVRRPVREAMLALAALAASGLANAFAFSEVAACVATDACFH